jgi:TIR domain-containing protein/NB-ARC domain-containing protein
MTIPQSPVKVFLSYAHKDERLQQKLLAQMSLLKRQGLISTWYDRQIVPGTNWAKEIDQHLELASLILFLISPDFMASDYCSQIEVKRALERDALGEARVIPIVLRPTDWETAHFAHLQALPTNAKAITTWSNQDTAFKNVAVGIRAAIQDLTLRLPSTTPPANGNQPRVNVSMEREPQRETNQQALQNHRSIEKTINSNPSVQSQFARFGAPFPEIWNVSRRHNAFVTGRIPILNQLFDGFRLEDEVGMISRQALTGLGGMGKTQVAAEYAYRFRGDYRAVLWVRAETQENLLTDFRTIAGLLKRPAEHLQDDESLIQTMQVWFRNQADWLLIFDNADNPALVDPFLPKAARGHILLTTRAAAIVEHAQPLHLKKLEPDDGALCILRRAGLPGNKQLQDVPAARVDDARQLAQLMDGLPLALEQAGAYIDDTGCGIREYLDLYQRYRAELQRDRHGSVPDYPESVASAWKFSKSSVEQSNPAAIELLRLCAYLAPEAIPDELVLQGASALGPVLGPVAANKLSLNLAISVLRKYSLLNREADRETELTTRLSIHRIMQEILIDEMNAATQELWATRTVKVVATSLPKISWDVLQAHAHNCDLLIKQWHMSFPEAQLLQQWIERMKRKRKR